MSKAKTKKYAFCIDVKQVRYVIVLDVTKSQFIEINLKAFDSRMAKEKKTQYSDISSVF